MRNRGGFFRSIPVSVFICIEEKSLLFLDRHVAGLFYCKKHRLMKYRKKL